jgi:hypothetical protein
VLQEAFLVAKVSWLVVSEQGYPQYLTARIKSEAGPFLRMHTVFFMLGGDFFWDGHRECQL